MRALERAAFLEAAEHFRRGLEALDAAGVDETGDLERVDLLTYRAASLQAAHGYAAAGVEEAYAAARRVCERTGAEDRLVSVNRGEWSFHLLRAEYGRALALGDEMLKLGEQAGDEVRLAEGHLYRGLVHMYLANFELARTHLEEAFTRYHRTDYFTQIYEAQGDTGVGALAYLALILWNLGYADESRERSDLSLELAEEVGGPVTRAQAWGMRSILHLARGEPVELRHWTEKTRAHSADLNIGYWRTVSLLHGAWQHGRARPAAPEHRRARGAARRVPGVGVAAQPSALLHPAGRPAPRRRRPAAGARGAAGRAGPTSSTPGSASRSPSCSASWAAR